MGTVVTPPTPSKLDDVYGWFFPCDQAVMTWLLDRQDRIEPPGDLVELGVYMGRSAIVVGTHLRPGETFTVLDLFGDSIDDDAVRGEQDWAYNNLTRRSFEANYLAFHHELPTVVQGPSSEILDHVKPGSCRFVHVDASHMFEHVAQDIVNARTLLREDGIMVCDDYRAEHTPGVAAAVWAAVATGDLHPIVITANKFYGTWAEPGPVQDELVDWLESQQPGVSETQEILGRRVVRVKAWAKPPLPSVPPLNPPPRTPAAPSRPPQSPPQSPPPIWRTVAREVLPPVVTKVIRRVRRP
jgi:predicted O-methyltransferase YrrM